MKVVEDESGGSEGESESELWVRVAFEKVVRDENEIDGEGEV